MLDAIHASRRSGPRKPAIGAVLLLLLGTVCAPALAAEDHPLLDRFSFTLGSFFTSVDTELRLDGPERGTGDRFDFEDTLDLGDSETLFRFSGEFRIKRRHQINFGYYELSRSATTALEREIQFGDQTFPVDIQVDGFFDTQVIEVSYTYWLIMKDKVVFGLSAGGVNFFTFDVGLTALGQAATITEGASTDVPVPLFGLEVRYALAPKWMLRARSSLISISGIEDYSGSVINLDVAVEYRVHKRFGVGAGFNGVLLDIDREQRSFTGAIEYSISGAQLFIRVGF